METSLPNRHVLLIAIVCIALTSALAAAFTKLHRSDIRSHVDQPSSTYTTQKTEPIQSQTRESTAQAIDQTVRGVIAGGGGTSTGAGLRIDGTVGEVGASGQMTGGAFTLGGGYWNTLTGAEGSPSPSPSPSGSPTRTPTPPTNVVQFSVSNLNVNEGCTALTVTVNRIGDTSGPAAVDYNTSDVIATERKDYITALGRLSFATGETFKSLVVLINDDSLVEGSETFNVNLSNPSGAGLGGPTIATVTINDNSSEPSTNVIDDARTYVCQHYHDFLNRQPDQDGWDFWTNQITSCGSDPACLEVKRLNVSAAFYLSIEFQNTGYLIERLYKTAYGDAPAVPLLGARINCRYRWCVSENFYLTLSGSDRVSLSVSPVGKQY